MKWKIKNYKSTQTILITKKKQYYNHLHWTFNFNMLKLKKTKSLIIINLKYLKNL